MTEPPKAITSLDDLIPDPDNLNLGTQRGGALLEESLRRYGAGRSILVDRNGYILAGNKTTEAAASIGMGRVKVVQTDGTEIVVVQRRDLDLADPASRARELTIADNRASELGLQWDTEALLAHADELDLSVFWRDDEIIAMMADAREPYGALDHLDDDADRETTPPRAQQRFPLAIVVDRATLTRWEAYKAAQRLKDDTAAFLKLLGASLDAAA